MKTNYWEHRFTRRRGIRAAVIGAVGVAGAALVGCGEDEVAPPASPTGTTTTPPAGSATEVGSAPTEASRGGTWQGSRTADIPSLDPLTSTVFLGPQFGGYVYGRLLKFKVGTDEPSVGDLEGDVAERFELSDETTITLHLREGHRWDERAPTSGRQIDSEDVVFSWNKFETSARLRSDLAHSVDEAAPIVGMEAVDERTVRVNLAKPWSPILPMLASSNHFFVMPRESDGGYDARSDARGCGPWVLEEHRPDSFMRFARNPNYYESDRPYLDGLIEHIIPEYSQALAQFRAQEIWGGVAQTQDVPDLFEQSPELTVVTGQHSGAYRPNLFGSGPGSPWSDERVRQAASRLIDRDQWIRSFNDVERLERAGLPVDIRWNSHIPAGWDGWWIDPRSDEFGETGAHFQFDPAEAQRLLDAAGFANGFTSEAYYISGTQYGRAYHDENMGLIGMMERGGISFDHQPRDHATDWPPILTGGHDHSGIAFTAAATPADLGYWLEFRYHSAGARTTYLQREEAVLDDLIEAQVAEFDLDARRELVHEFQRVAAERMYNLPMPGATPPLDLWWPWAKGPERVFGWIGAGVGGPPAETFPHRWYDESAR